MMITDSMDKTVRLWEISRRGDGSGTEIIKRGKLMQGYLALPKYEWYFPLGNHPLRKKQARTDLEWQLKEQRKKMDDKMSNKKKEQIK